MVRVDLAQKSEAWLLWRDIGLGSSDAAVIWYGSHFGKTIDKLREEKVANLEKIKVSQTPLRTRSTSSMARGVRLEPEARRIYERWMGRQVEVFCAIHDQYPFLKVSLDGWLDHDAGGIAVEIKAPNRQDHLDAISGKVPEKYLPQLWHQQLVTGAHLSHYISYNDYFPGLEKFSLVSLPRDEDILQELLQRETAFWNSIQNR